MTALESHSRLDVAVVGAGLSGLVCAQALVEQGHRVRVFEKARGPGGRMSTRRAEARRFDHGAQYFTVRDARFARAVEAWRRGAVAARWHGRISVLGGDGTRSGGPATERFVGVPGMSAICAHLAADLDITFETRVGSLERVRGRWRTVSEGGAELGVFDAIVVSAPAPQAADLLAAIAPKLAVRAAAVEMAPCWAVMVSFPGRLELPFDGAFVHDSPLSWIARNGSKPGRPAEEAWVLHASPEWSREHLELDRDAAAKALLEAFRFQAGGSSLDPVHVVAHRWRFALPVEPLTEQFLFDGELHLGACGDWCAGPRIEGAFLSGSALAGRLSGVGAAAEPLT